MKHSRIDTIVRRADMLLGAQPSSRRLMHIHKVLGRIINSRQFINGPVSKAHELMSKTHALLHLIKT